MDIIGIGTSCVDFLIHVKSLPKPNEGTRIMAYSLQGGGKVPTALVAAARLGARCGMVGIVGDCNYGQFCIEDYKYHDIDVTRFLVDQNSETPFSCVLSEEATHGRNILYHPSNVRLLTVKDLDKEYISSAQYLHLSDTNEVTQQAAKWVREKNGTIVYDADHYQSHIENFIPMIDIFVASEFYYNTVFSDKNYEANLMSIFKMGPRIVVFTLGEIGCVGMDIDGFFFEPGFKVDVVDTTGAGDVYHGAFIYGLLQGWSVQKTARFSNAVSAIKCTRIGGRAGIPDLSTVQKFLDTGFIDYRKIDERVKRYQRRGL